MQVTAGTEAAGDAVAAVEALAPVDAAAAATVGAVVAGTVVSDAELLPHAPRVRANAITEMSRRDMVEVPPSRTT